MFEGLRLQVINILTYSWPTIVMGIIIAILLRLTYLFTNKEKLVLHEELFKLSFIIYILCLFYIVTFQDVNYSSYNYIPFREILRYEFGSKLFFKNILGNVLLFMPYGLFIAKYVKTNKMSVVIFITFLTSISIEVIQFMIGRVYDIDDVILNVIGSLLGYLIYKLFKKINDKLPKFFKTDLFLDMVAALICGGLIWYLIP